MAPDQLAGQHIGFGDAGEQETLSPAIAAASEVLQR
jgi:hypothetical protein